MTVAGLEADLLTLLSPYLLLVGLDGTTADGTNEALRIPIRRAVSRLSGSALEATTDDDLEGLDPSTLLLLAEYQTIWLLLGHYSAVDQSKGETSQSLSQRAGWLQWRLEWLKKALGTLAEEPAANLSPGAPATGLIRAGRGCGPFDANGRPTSMYPGAGCRDGRWGYG